MQDDVVVGGEEVGTGAVEEAVVPPVVEELVSVPVPVPEPVVEPVQEAVPEPVPVPIPEPVVEPVPEPIAEPTPVPEVAPPPIPEPPVKPVDTPPVASPTTPVVSEEAEPLKAEPEPVKPVEVVPPVPVSAPDPPKDTGGIPQKVLDLTDEELHAAYWLWGTKTIRRAKEASVKARHQKLEQNLEKVRSYVKANPNSKVSTIARKTNFTLTNTSYYLSLLLKQNKLKATGATTSRRYS